MHATTKLKNSPAVFIQKVFQDGLYHILPRSVSRYICADVMSKHSICFSNVPGPQQPLAVAGKEVVAVEVVYPNVLPQVCLFSYNGRISGNFVVDSLVPKPQIIADLFAEEVLRLAMVVGVDPAEFILP
ncbi:hypothetical protein AAMO2058_001740200 [Amorphochlora amoebiformis]